MNFRLFLIVLLISIKSTAQQLSIQFESSSYKVSESSIEAIKVFVREYGSCQYHLAILGRTDDIGSEADNIELSRKRSEAVLELVVAAGKDKTLISIDWMGEMAPLADNKDEKGRSINRSVVITCTERICETAATGDVEDLYRQLKDEGQRFCIDPSKDTALVGKSGSIIYYKQGTFKTVPCNCITIVLHEFYQPSSMILNNLTTTSNDRTLESGGMIRLEGFCGNEILEYQPGRSLPVFIPADSTLPGMKLFTANRLQQKEILDWKDVNGDLETVDADGLGFVCAFRNGIDYPDCPLFFCKIRQLFTNKLRQQKKADQVNEAIYRELALVQKYGLDRSQLGQAIQAGKAANKDLLKYYVYQNASWNYYNIDRYKSGVRFNDYYVREPYQKDTDVKLVYQTIKTVLPFTGNSYRFKDVMNDQAIWLIGLRYRNGIPYLAMEHANSSSKKCTLNFKEETIETIKTALQRID